MVYSKNLVTRNHYVNFFNSKKRQVVQFVLYIICIPQLIIVTFILINYIDIVSFIPETPYQQYVFNVTSKYVDNFMLRTHVAYVAI